MKFHQRALWAACLLLPVAGGIAYYRSAEPASNDRDPLPLLAQLKANSQPGAAQVRALQVPLGFEPNRGQVDHRVDYVARGPGYSLFLTASEAVFSLVVPAAQATQSTVLRLSLIGANRAPTVQGREQQPGVSHYLTGARSAHVERFGNVRYNGVYPGIDVVYYGNQHELEYDFIVAPGADPGRIGLRFGGAHAVKLDAAGNLVLSTEGGDVVQHKPIAYQEIDGKRRAVDSRYRVQADRSVAFEVSAYDRAHALVIDPVVVYRVPFYGDGSETSTSIAVDADGNTYVTGYTSSLNFPVTPNAPQPEHAGGFSDVFVAKINAAGDALVWNTFLGGTGDDIGRGIAVDADGRVVVAGDTDSTDFPVVAAMQPSLAGYRDGFVARLSADGSALIYSTYLGSPSGEYAFDVAAGRDGSAYVTGATDSKLFPQTIGTGGCPTGIEGKNNCTFVTKLAPDGALAYGVVETSSFVVAIAVDREGAAYFGGMDYVRKLAPDGVMQHRKRIEGINFGLTDIAVDDDGAVYLLGRKATARTPAINSDLTLDTSNAVCKLDPDFASLEYCAHVGVARDDSGAVPWQQVNGIAVDDEGGVVVVGTNNRSDSSLSTDAFVQAITPSGRSQRFMRSVGSTLPQTTSQSGLAVAVDPTGNSYVTGSGGWVNFGFSFVARMTPADWKIVGAGDIDADGRTDLFWHNRGLEQFHTWSMRGATRTAVHEASISLEYRVAARADFNGDNRTDVLWYDERKTSVWLWQAEADGTFSIHFVADHPPAGWDIAGAGDVNGDGRADILWHNRRMEELDWWLMDGAALRFVGSQYVPSQYGVTQVADFSGDGRADLVWEDNNRTTLWLWRAVPNDFAIEFLMAHPESTP